MKFKQPPFHSDHNRFKFKQYNLARKNEERKNITKQKRFFYNSDSRLVPARLNSPFSPKEPLKKAKSYGNLHEIQKCNDLGDAFTTPNRDAKEKRFKSGKEIKRVLLTPIRLIGRRFSPRPNSTSKLRTQSIYSKHSSLCVALNFDMESANKKDKKSSQHRIKSRLLEKEKLNNILTKTTPDNLADHLKNKVTLQLFRKFLQQEFNEENLNFWLEVEKYKAANKERNRRMCADKIFATFILRGSPNEVNLDSTMRESLLINRGSLEKDLFNLAQDHIFKLMENDPFCRYIKQKQKKLQSNPKLIKSLSV